MARSITLTLGAALGADLGPNFNLTANVGVVTPSTATKTELLAGKSVSVDDLATQVTVTSTGTCTNAITQTIPCATTTTTTTETPTTTTTTTTTIAPIVCTSYNIQGTGLCEYEDCDGTPLSFFCDTYCNFTICTNGVISVGPEMIATVVGDCSPTTTTTTVAPTTTTTTNSGASNFFVENINGTGQIDDVDNGGGAYFYFVSNGSFPLTSGQALDGVSSSLTSANIRVFVSNTSSGGCLVLYINTTPIDSLVVPNAGNYTFNNITYGTADTVQIKYTNGACP